jgi:SAM-dependent methyltransferase
MICELIGRGGIRNCRVLFVVILLLSVYFNANLLWKQSHAPDYVKSSRAKDIQIQSLQATIDDLRQDNFTRQFNLSQVSSELGHLFSILREKDTKIDSLRQDLLNRDQQIAATLSSGSSVSCPFFGGSVLPGTANAPNAQYRNPGTRDDWILKISKTVAPHSAVLDMSSGERPYRKLFEHCKYHSHEFQGNNDIQDTLRGPGADKSGRKYDYVGDILNSGAPSDFFDVVLLTEVLEHVPEPLLALRELARVAKPGGRIVVTAPFIAGSHQQPYHFSSGFPLEFYEHAAIRFNLEIVDKQSQGDYWLLLLYEINRAIGGSCGAVKGANPAHYEQLKLIVGDYLTKMSAEHGDGRESPNDCTNMLTIGFMVEFRKK